MKIKRLQPCKLLLSALLAGISCGIFMASSLSIELHETGMQPMDFYWLYFGMIPEDWITHFDIIRYIFALIPITLVAYIVSDDIQSNLIETKYAVVIRYQSIRRWIMSGCQVSIAITACFFLIFHSVFLMMNHIVCHQYTESAISVFSNSQTGSILVLILKHIFFVSTLSMIQIVVALHRNIQTGVLVELCIGGAVVFLDLLQITSNKLFCADSNNISLIYNIVIFAIVLVFILLTSSNSTSEKYLG